MSVSCTFLDLDTDFVLNLPEVTTAKEQIDKQTQGSIYFTIQLTPSIRRVLTENLNLNCSSIDTVPMRWIKGDTHPHIDKGTHSFDTTYLAYLTDSPGNLMIDGKSYPIAKRSAYIFSEGLSHETIETGSVPRLLLGPMSENGISVGGSGISADGQTETIYIYTTVYGLRYRINDGGYNGLNFPVIIQNTNTNTAYPLKVLFETDITIATNGFFICDSDNIQFGSTSLKNDGTRPVITIDGVTDYPGLIQNGLEFFGISRNDINVYNITVAVSNGSTLAEGGGWIGQTYFGNGVSNNNIVNCSSTGDISARGGGIVGSFAGINGSRNYTVTNNGSGNYVIDGLSNPTLNMMRGFTYTFTVSASGHPFWIQTSTPYNSEDVYNTGVTNNGTDDGIITFAVPSDAPNTLYYVCQYHSSMLGTIQISESVQTELNLIGCSSFGAIGQDGGGIVGQAGGNNGGNVFCRYCWSTGEIGTGDIGGSAGGIYGSGAGEAGAASARICYSEGIIGTEGGGIYGSFAGQTSGSADASLCYSRGDIGTDGGGIFGANAADAGGTTTATNCYSSGTWTVGDRGIYGTGEQSGATSSNCYSANGAWTNSAANAALDNTPIPPAIVGNEWVSTGTDMPYELRFFGYSPYSITNITDSASLNQVYVVSITAGESTPAAIVSGKSYEILQIFLGDPSSYGTITIDSNTGVVSTTSATSATEGGYYEIFIRNEGSYNITGMVLFVNANAVPNAPICFPAGTLVLTDQGEVAIDKIDIKKNTIGGKGIIAITETIPLDNYLICIEKGSLSYNVPNRRTIISKDHKIMCNKNLIRAECLIEYTPSAYKVNYDKKKLYNVLLREHSTMSVNNLTVETLNPKSSVAKIYTGNYTPKQRNGLIKAFNKYNQEMRKKTVLSRNIFIR